MAGSDSVVLDLSHPSGDAQDGAFRFLKDWSALHPERSPVALVPPFGSGRMETAARLAIDHGVAMIILPDASSGADVQRLDMYLRVMEARLGLAPGITEIIALAGAAGLLLSAGFRRCSRRLVGLGWDLNCDPASDTARLARATIALAASAAGVSAIDPASVTRGEKTFRSECATALENGYAGKLTRAAWQVPIINDIFGN